MLLRSLITFDEAFGTAERVANIHNYRAYTGQAYASYRSSHGGVVRFGLLRYILRDLLSLDDGDYFVDLGSGCGIISNCVGIYKPLVTSIGIEFHQGRINVSYRVCNTLQQYNTKKFIRSFSPPLFIHGDITDEHTMEYHLTQPNLKMFFNNFNALMLYDCIQQAFERLANDHCLIGTMIVTLEPLFFGDNIWTRSQFNHTVMPHELSWMAPFSVIQIYVYRRYA